MECALYVTVNRRPSVSSLEDRLARKEAEFSGLVARPKSVPRGHGITWASECMEILLARLSDSNFKVNTTLLLITFNGMGFIYDNLDDTNKWQHKRFNPASRAISHAATGVSITVSVTIDLIRIISTVIIPITNVVGMDANLGWIACKLSLTTGYTRTVPLIPIFHLVAVIFPVTFEFSRDATAVVFAQEFSFTAGRTPGFWPS